MTKLSGGGKAVRESAWLIHSETPYDASDGLRPDREGQIEREAVERHRAALTNY